MNRILKALAAALLGAATVSAVAASYNDEVSNLIRSGKTAKALGPDVFGDRINYYTGALEFVQSDVAIPGNDALPVSVGRRLAPGWAPRKRLGLFGDWDLEIPRLQGTFSNRNGWSTGGAAGNKRCTNFDGPGTVLGTNNASSWDQEEYWRGNLLYTPGQGETEILRRTTNTPAAPNDGYSYPLVTKNHWALRCGTLQSNAYYTASVNNQGEGFVARSPDGFVYRFDWLVRRDAELMTRASPISTVRGTQTDPVISGSERTPAQPNAAANALLSRDEVWILPTEVKDRFGNWVRYSFDPALPWRLLSISSSDGRTISFTYVGTTNRVNTVNDGTRTWTYVYGSTGELTAVTQPDSTQLTISGSDSVSVAGSVGVDLGCTGGGNPDLSASGVQTISFSHPSGAQGVFSLRYTSHARSFVPQVCFGDSLSNARYPRYFATKSLVGKQMSGVGMPTQTWTYAYSAVNGQGNWSTCTGTCPETKTVTVTGPDGANKVMTFGTRHNTTDGKLLRTDEYSTAGALLRTTAQAYRIGREMGLSVLDMGDGATSSMRQDPLSSKTITQQGVAFNWYGDAVDSFDRTTQERRAGPGGTRTETTTYSDNFSVWVLGQVRQVANSGGQLMVDRDFDPATATLKAVREFGVLKESIDYNPDGTVSGRRDGANRLTSFGDYKRGIARLVTYPDQRTESVTVNDLGWITSHTNPATYTTQYGYDNTWGLITSVTPPAGFTATALRFEKITTAEYGLPAGHWRHTTTKGTATTQTFLDAYWRPVMTRTFDAANEAATRKVTVTGYDASGRVSFESYPQRDLGDVAVTSPGTRTQYDSLGRKTQMQADSELGVLTTSIAYLNGFQTQTTNPRSKTTTQGFWALDDPAKAQLATISAPAGVNVTIARDIFGKPTAITRSGTFAGYTSNVTRRYVYDAGQRLCKTIEPEVGSTVQVYDAAGNIDWKAPGQALPDPAACNDASVPLAARITYGYDLLNRLKTVTYGDGSPAVSRTYTPDGLLETITSNGGTWTYGYNALRKLATESFAYGGQTYTFAWGYNTAGDLSALTYPDRTVTYSPNALGESQSVSGFAISITYHPNGAVATYTLANGIAHSLTQNVRGLPLVNRDAGVLQDLYGYDQNGNVASITDQQEAVFNRTLGYDDLDRLTSASAPGVWGTASYAYDPVDNLRAATVGSRSTVLNFGANNQLASVTTNGVLANYGFDARGNLTAKGAQTFGFDLGNRLTTSSLGGSYAYDGHGRRFRVVSTDGSTRMQLYSQAGQILWATSAGGARPTSTTAYIYLGGKAIAEANSASGTQYLHTDALGSPVARTNTAGAVINRTRYEPYGYVAAGVKPSPSVGALGFTGHVQDTETDLVYMQQRYYDPLAGRFLSVDPVVTNASTGSEFGRYVYVNDTPYGAVDPDGRLTNAECREMGASRCTVLVGSDKSDGKDLKAAAGQLDVIARAYERNGVWDQAPETMAASMAVLSFFAGPLGTGGRMVTVGRWMSAAEHEAMLASGRVVESFSGTTHVASPANVEAFMKQAAPGSRYVTFSVPASVLRSTSQGWAKIVGPSSLEGRLLAKKGTPILEMPTAADIVWIASKIR